METQLEQFRFPRINWGAIWAGGVVGLGMQIVLTALGLGIAMRAIDFNVSEPLRNLPVGVEVWSGLAWIFAAFMGAYVSAWFSGSFLRSSGIFHGMVTWGFMMSAFMTVIMGLLIAGKYGAFSGVKGLTGPLSVETLDAMCWWLFGAGLVSLGFAYLGGRIGVRAAQESMSEQNMSEQKMYRAA
jgi:hypothetical protein